MKFKKSCCGKFVFNWKILLVNLVKSVLTMKILKEKNITTNNTTNNTGSVKIFVINKFFN